MWRNALRSLNMAAIVTLMGVLFILVTWVSGRRYARWDLSRQQLSTLSGQTRQVLDGLQEPLRLTLFFEPGHRLLPLVKDLAQEYERLSPRISVVEVDPQQDMARAQQLVQELAIDAPNVMIVQSGARHKRLSEADLAEFDYAAMTVEAEPRVKAFKGEAAVTSAILSVTQTAQPLVWCTTGHGEKAIDSTDPMGLADLKRHLEQQNMRVEAVSLLERQAVDPDVDLIILAGPTHRFVDQELALLDAFLARGGGVLVLLDPLTDSGLEPWLARAGITADNDIVVDPALLLPNVSPGNLLVMTYSEHPIVRKMKTLMTLFPLARSMRPSEAPVEAVTVKPLALTSPKAWGEMSPRNEEFKFDPAVDIPGPLAVAAAAERATAPAATDPAGLGQPGRVVAIGDSDFVVNAQLANIGNRDFLQGAVQWLAAQEQLIGIGPKTLESLKLSLTAGQLSRSRLLLLLGFPGLLLATGCAVWWRRRS